MERIWIYGASREIQDMERPAIELRLKDFILRWAAHNKKLNARYEILYNRFILLSVDEEQAAASGCSIDESVRFLKELEKDFSLSLFERQNMLYLKKDKVQSCPLKEIGERLESGEISEETIVFNPQVSNSEEMKYWLIPFKSSGYASLASSINKSAVLNPERN